MKPQASHIIPTGTQTLESETGKAYFRTPDGKFGRIMGDIPTAETKQEFAILEYVTSEGEVFYCIARSTMKVTGTL